MRYRCMCLVIHAPPDLRLDEQDAGEIGPGQVLVRVGFGGICGSDLHYFHHGGFGTVRIQQPMVLGHEVAGSVAAVADDVTSVQVGDRVAVNPSRLVGDHYLGRRARWHRRLRLRRRRPSRVPGLMTWMRYSVLQPPSCRRHPAPAAGVGGRYDGAQD